MPESPHLFEFLTREEWRMCYAVQFLDDFEEYEDAFSLDRYATPGQEGTPDCYEESFRRAIRFLALEHGYEFQALRPQEDGSMYADEPITPENTLYVNLLSIGKSPNIPGCLETLLSKAPPTVNSEAIREALHEVREVARHVETQALDKADSIQAEIRRRRQALSAWGVTTGDGKEMVH